MAREYFCAYHSYLEWIESLSDAEKGRLFVACLEYSKTGEVPDLRGSERVIFPAIRRQIDRDKEEYERKCERNRANGALGGKANGKRSVANAPRTGSERPPREKGKGEREKSAIADNTPLTPLEGAIEEFKQFRKAIRKPMTERAVQLLRGKLEQLAPGDDERKIAIINQSILQGWQGVFELKQATQQDGNPFARLLREGTFVD